MEQLPCMEYFFEKTRLQKEENQDDLIELAILMLSVNNRAIAVRVKEYFEKV